MDNATGIKAMVERLKHVDATGRRVPTLPEFLSARIAEDEAYARGPLDDEEVIWARRSLSECEAKRRFLQEAEDQVSEYFSRFILETLALPYADHPDYRDEWRP